VSRWFESFAGVGGHKAAARKTYLTDLFQNYLAFDRGDVVRPAPAPGAYESFLPAKDDRFGNLLAQRTAPRRSRLG
jgi:hypothetical protein